MPPATTPGRRSGDHPARTTLSGLDRAEVKELAEAVHYRHEALKRTGAAMGAGHAGEMVTAKLAVLHHLAIILADAKQDLECETWAGP